MEKNHAANKRKNWQADNAFVAFCTDRDGLFSESWFSKSKQWIYY